jgi:hypothetical protein
VLFSTTEYATTVATKREDRHQLQLFFRFFGCTQKMGVRTRLVVRVSPTQTGPGLARHARFFTKTRVGTLTLSSKVRAQFRFSEDPNAHQCSISWGKSRTGQVLSIDVCAMYRTAPAKQHVLLHSSTRVLLVVDDHKYPRRRIAIQRKRHKKDSPECTMSLWIYQ